MTKGSLLHSSYACWKRWVPRGIAVLALALAGVGAVHADVPIGSLPIGSLGLGNVSGYQQVSFYNFTGSAGCDGSYYEVCNAITVDNWTLTLTFSSEGDTDPVTDTFTSPWSFSSLSPADDIGPYGSAPAFTPFTGGASGTWQIPLSVGNAGEPSCPACDYELTQVEFSGTLSTGQLYLGADPNNLNNDGLFNANPNFDAIWSIAATDYTGLTNPLFFGDSTDVFVSPASIVASVPEPASLPLLGGELLFVIGLLKLLYSHAKDRFRRASQN